MLFFASNIYFIVYKILSHAQNFLDPVSSCEVSALPNNLNPCFHCCSDVGLIAGFRGQSGGPYLVEKGGEDVHDWQV